MQKPKIMLTTIIVMAVVAGALSFNIKKSDIKMCIYTTNEPGPCGLPTLGCVDGLTTAGATVYLTTRATITISTNPAIACPAPPTDCTILLSILTEE